MSAPLWDPGCSSKPVTGRHPGSGGPYVSKWQMQTCAPAATGPEEHQLLQKVQAEARRHCCVGLEHLVLQELQPVCCYQQLMLMLSQTFLAQDLHPNQMRGLL